MTKWRFGALVGATAVLGGVGVFAMAAGAGAHGEAADQVVEIVEYTASGELIRPKDYRTWVFVGAPLTPNDMNNGSAAFPEFHNVYIDPGAYEEYKQTGKFRDGTVFIKELVSVGQKSSFSGNGYFEGEFLGVEAMVKSAERNPDIPGNWGFFRFTDEEAAAQGRLGNVKRTAKNVATSCVSCHAAGEQDRIFTQHYPVLRAARNAKMNPENK
ncbi:MAG: cytochrome P460 family protein [Planctomycetota bacterium]